VVDKLQSEIQAFKDQSGIETATEKCLQQEEMQQLRDCLVLHKEKDA
jgi:hypothetical protein